MYFVNIIGSNGCMLKAFGENAFVCVCNSTYCDTVENTEPQKASNGEYSLYLSDNTGKRLLHSYGSTNKQAKGIGRGISGQWVIQGRWLKMSLTFVSPGESIN